LTLLRSFLQRQADESRVITSQDYWGAWARGDDVGTSGYQTPAGVYVSREAALSIAAVWRCVSLIADAIATMPAYAYTGDERTKQKLSAQPSWLKNANSEQTFLECVHQQIVSLLLDGTAYIYTPRDQYGDVLEMWLVDARLVIPRREPDPSGRLVLQYYVYPQPTVGSYYAPTPPDNFRGHVRLSQLEMFHIRALTLPGWLRGVPPLEMARNMIGSAIAGQDLGTRFFGQGMNAPGVVEVAEDMDDEQVRQLKDDFRARATGLHNMHVPPILTGGATFKPTIISPEQAQFLESRKFSVAEVARWFGVPPHMVGDVEKSTSWGAGIEQQGIAFVTNTLRPWMERVERAYSRYMLLFEPEDYIRFDESRLLRGDSKTRAEVNASAIGWGWKSPNEARIDDGMPPREGGDEFLSPLNMQISGAADPTATIKAVSPPQATPQGTPPESEEEQK
jgi:HK97 family phage portal protein